MEGTINLLRVNNSPPGIELSDFPPVYYITLIFHVVYIPLITVPSILVICAVIFMSKLHTPHNIILLAISASDLLLALVAIPIYVLLDATLTSKLTHPYLFLFMLADTVELINFSVLTLLGLDTFLQITFPIKYKTKISKKNTIASIITIVLLTVCICTFFFGLRVSTKQNKMATKAYKLYMMIVGGLLLLLCIFFGFYVRYKRRKVGKTTHGKITAWLLIAFIIFYIPTIIFMAAINIEKLISGRYLFDLVTFRLFNCVTGLIRHLSSLTNGIFIYLSRPVYKFAFIYFLKTNPIHWKRVEDDFYISQMNRRRSMANVVKYSIDHKPFLEEVIKYDSIDSGSGKLFKRPNSFGGSTEEIKKASDNMSSTWV